MSKKAFESDFLPDNLSNKLVTNEDQSIDIWFNMSSNEMMVHMRELLKNQEKPPLQKSERFRLLLLFLPFNIGFFYLLSSWSWLWKIILLIPFNILLLISSAFFIEWLVKIKNKVKGNKPYAKPTNEVNTIAVNLGKDKAEWETGESVRYEDIQEIKKNEKALMLEVPNAAENRIDVHVILLKGFSEADQEIIVNHFKIKSVEGKGFPFVEVEENVE